MKHIYFIIPLVLLSIIVGTATLNYHDNFGQWPFDYANCSVSKIMDLGWGPIIPNPKVGLLTTQYGPSILIPFNKPLPKMYCESSWFDGYATHSYFFILFDIFILNLIAYLLFLTVRAFFFVRKMMKERH